MNKPGIITLKSIKIISLLILIWGVLSWLGLVVLSYFQGLDSLFQLPLVVGNGFLLIPGVPLLILWGLGDCIYTSIKSKKVTPNSFFPVVLVLIPIIIIFLFFYTYQLYGSTVSWYIQDTQFNAHFSQYQDMVEKIKAGKAIERPDHNGFLVPKGFPVGAIFADERKEESGQNIWLIKFATFGGIPGVRGGYTYISDETVIKYRKKYAPEFRYRQIKPNWYAFSI